MARGNMKHCENCAKCKKNILAQYLKALNKFECLYDGHEILSPFWEGMKCDKYKKDTFNGR